MKDKKFAVLCVMGAIWLVIVMAMFFGLRINRNFLIMLTLVPIGWFAYWTLSTVRNLTRKTSTPSEPEPESTTSKIKLNGNKQSN